jgi:triphosphoribosyl-dephospho-CoA synthetase
MAATLSKVEKELESLVKAYNSYLKSKGSIEEWTDKFLITARDKFRKVSRRSRGLWSFEFYEALQELNKESIKRDLSPGTK